MPEATQCRFEGCGKDACCKGLCQGHYRQQYKGQSLRPLRKQGATSAERFRAKVAKSGSCWEWQGYLLRGYGRFWVDGGMVYAHRFAYEAANGSIPEGMQVDHTCHNPPCVNPAHLRLVTLSQNHQNLSGPQADSTSGYRGVSWYGRHRAWVAEVQLNGQRHRLGYFGTAEEAHEIASAWRREHMPYSIKDQTEETS